MKTPWPHWCEWRPNQLWYWDGSQFERCAAAKHAYAIVDVVSRKWISTHLTANPDSVAARVLFSRGLDNEGLLTDELRARLTDPATLAAELERVRVHHNSVRLHEAIGYVTPNDEHDGRGDTISAARTDGMRTADQQRRA